MNGIETLTKRDIEWLRLMSEGYSNEEIAYRSCITKGTLNNEVNFLYNKIGAINKTNAVALAIRQGII